MNFSLKNINRYCEQHTTPVDEVLYELERETYLKTLAPQMMSGHLQGHLLTLLSRLAQPKSILEIGTFTGYATICLARGLAEGGVLHTIEANQELHYIIKKYLAKAALTEVVQLYKGKAEQIIPIIEGMFDLVFIDAGKRLYAEHYDLIIDRVVPGGLILVDNVLWSGKVTQRPQYHDKDTQILHAFNEKIQQDNRVENILLPLRDGLMIIQKK